jgi:hypothetical protein
MIRVSCLWLRPGILAERAARVGSTTLSVYLKIRGLVSEKKLEDDQY